MVKTTAHADLRSRKRYKKADFSREFEEALKYGTPVKEFKGEFGRFLRSRMREHKNNGVIYKNSIFWYNHDTLVTVFPLHQKWHKYTNK